MFTKKIYPNEISKQELDRYLGMGWYRMGQGIFTCHFLSFGEHIYSALWLRLDLNNFSFKKSQRRLFRKNSHFEIKIRPAHINRQKEDLYQKYRWHSFKGNISISLRDSLLDGKRYNIYDTLECCLYDGDKLIAVSFFDRGKDTLASIMGMYDPDYQAYSLGYFTMLLEIEYGIDNGYAYYYPGYIVPGYPRFDYKARIGTVDYYQIASKQWLPFEGAEVVDYPLQNMEKRLELLHTELKRYGISSRIYFYPLYETHIFSFWEIDYLKYPVFLWCDTLDGSSEYLLVVYDLSKQTFLLLQCELLGKLPVFLEELFEDRQGEQPTFLETLVVKHTIVIEESTTDFAISLSKLKRLRRFK
ncbi:MAG: GNAT family N-acetyltransferase [Bacteroidota bacterium]